MPNPDTNCKLITVLSLSLFTLFVISQPNFLRSNNMASSYHGLRNALTSVNNEGLYQITIIADLDKKSKVDGKKLSWHSLMKKGELRYDQNTKTYSISWLEDQELFTQHGEAGRGMELSELIWFNGKLYAMDDRSGIVFEILLNKSVAPRFILPEGDGNTDKGMKIEWATVKDDHLYIGSFGKEYTNSEGKIVNQNNMWVATINKEGKVQFHDWSNIYNKLRNATGTPYPGYMIHEAVCWSEVHKEWFILPRRVSPEPYDDVKDEKKGSNTLIRANEDFSDIKVSHVTPLTPTRGFSSFKFLPNSNDNIIVALKSEENDELHSQNAFITVFNIDGTVLLPETEIPGGHKYEGLEFAFP